MSDQKGILVTTREYLADGGDVGVWVLDFENNPIYLIGYDMTGVRVVFQRDNGQIVNMSDNFKMRLP